MEKLSLGAYLKRVRVSRKLSTHDLERLSKEIGVSKSITAGQISKIENDKVDARFKTIQNIVELLDIPVVFVFDGGEEKIDAVTVVSTNEIAQMLPEALSREKLVELLVLCMEFTDEQIEAILGVARVIRGLKTNARDSDG